MVPDIVEIKRLCSSGQWNTRIENGKILLHDTVAGETVCIGQTDAEPVRHGEWKQNKEPLGWQDVDVIECSKCGESWVIDDDFDFELCKMYWNYCPNCGAKMDGKK